ncbi:ParB/RepB/Spo0J family partition protein [Streptomyces sp. 351MFTsu5.1]|uniref:ParB/RepB/Spo0J family partition protein n=1 Tax=Streptomyces sp. 351MFTsu5.1 TaxID=1172180 RepID=UPI00037D4A28|nr:ParB N-terminal domain-containing protein [Streptomyces sp. 351MFTsu5.1]
MNRETAPDRPAARPELNTGSPEAQWAPTLSPVESVPIDALLPGDSPRIAGESPEHLRSLAEAAEPLPPITVHRPTMRVIDGMHRLRVAAEQGRTHIPARFFDGAERDAFALSVQHNTRHGLPLSTADRTAAATRILTSHPEWSDRMVASITGLSTKSVRALRRTETELIPQATTRLGRDGRLRPVDSSPGRLRASELLRANPQASLRAVAGEAGISPGTVRDVRDRLRRGEDPLPAKRRPAAGRTPAAPVSCSGRPSRNRQQDPVSALERLTNDPALRLTESGRHLLRLLAANIMGEEHRDRLLRDIPPHCADRISQLALECAEGWWRIAQQVDGGQGRPRSGAADGDAPRAAGPLVPAGPGRGVVAAAV